jgi:hypothetical protein
MNYHEEKQQNAKALSTLAQQIASFSATLVFS